VAETSSATERAIGWSIKERYRTMRGYKREDSIPNSNRNGRPIPIIGVPVIVVPIIVFLQFSDSLIVSVLEAWHGSWFEARRGVWNGGRHEIDPTHPLSSPM